jgi:hypothetical protein
MHQIIADYIEHTNFDDPAQFPLLCQHNSHCNPEKAFHYTFKAITHLLDKGSAYEIGQCVDLLQDALPLLTTVVDADVLQIMVYNVRKRVDELGAEKGSTKFASLAASTLAGGLFGAVTALSSRWRGGAGGKGANAVTPLTIIDEGVSGKSSRSVASTKADPTSKSCSLVYAPATGIVMQSISHTGISGKGAASFKNAVKKVIDTNVTSPPNSARLTGGIASGSSKKESREFASNDRAKAYFKEKLKILDSNIDTKVSQFTSAEKYGEHKDWQHTLIMQTPKKELALVASPVKFFSRAGSATKQFFAPYFKRSASLASQVSGEQQSQSNLQNQSTNDLGSQVAEPAGDQSMVSYANRQHRNEGSATWE